MRSKEYHLVKQGLCELEAKKKKKFKIKIAYIVEVGSINTSNPYLLPLSNSFDFDFSFLILPDIISNNTLVFFFIKYSKFSFSFYIVSLYPFY